ncbi:M20 family metallopeptidase [Bdellovibrio sp. HCB337]|uniref:M20 family metallopeptidase n=1 Tax=Bdellovibrio sp. HCB337 TaxID=3394358 RepID=UPI0039A52D0D
MDFIEACRKFISIDSTPTHGNKEVAEYAAKLCQERGLHVEVQKDFIGDIEHVNVIARPQAERPSIEFLMQTHLDTVEPGPFPLWTFTECNPFDATIIDGKIYGLGAADVKLDFLCKLEALASFEGPRNWKLPPVLVGTYGEELGMQGALRLIRKNKIAAKMALIGEPSDLKMISAAKGYASVEVRIPFSPEEIAYRQEHNLKESTSTQSKLFIGKAAHSSTPHLGESAIAKMLEYLQQLPDSVALMEIDGGVNHNSVPSHALLEIDIVPNSSRPIVSKVVKVYEAAKSLEKEFAKFVDKDFFPSEPTLNIGLIRTYEDHVLIAGSCRIPPIISNETYESWMEYLRKVCEENGSQFRVTDYKKPFRTNETSILVKGCRDELRAMGLSEELTTQPSTNEASIFSRTGIDCLCFGPGKREGNVHTPSEHVAVEDLHKAVEFYKRVIERFCL